MKFLLSIYLLILCLRPAYGQKGDWYTYSTGKQPFCHLVFGDDELVVDRTDPVFREEGISGRKKMDNEADHIQVLKKITKNNRIYLIFQSFDGLYFCTTFLYFKAQDSLLMYCADGVDDGYKSLAEAVAAINKDKGQDFSITLYKKEKLDQQLRKQPISKITEQDFGAGLQKFSDRMDKFWQDRGYGRFEPYHGWMNLIYGNAFANGFDEKYNKLSLTGKQLSVPISNYSGNTGIKRLLESAGFLKSEN